MHIVGKQSKINDTMMTISLKKPKIYYPWASFIASLCVITFFFVTNNNSALLISLSLPSYLPSEQIKYILLFFFLLILTIDLVFHNRRSKQMDTIFEKHEKLLSELQTSRNALQNRVQKYSGHADKLKLFISDRLLEHIEYDEKFLHFQNIAAEVRHNGVISYDKVNTALQDALTHSENDKNQIYLDALHAMGYLWDLLDLSTTDNIGLYIAEKIYVAEEHYYRQQFETEKSPAPFSPIFSTRTAVIKALAPFIHDLDEKLPLEGHKKTPYEYTNSRFRIHLKYSDHLLGNENYIILMLENLINNSLYYINQKKYSSKHSRVNISLNKSGKYSKLSIYNPGPTITEETRENLFKLGYSTKRRKGVNGKGLGLYFVNEIINAYEGKIEINNIQNKPEQYAIKLNLENDQTLTEQLDASVNPDGRIVTSRLNKENLNNDISFKTNKKITGIEITLLSRKKTYSLNHLFDRKNTLFIDPVHANTPHWYIQLKHLKSGTRVIFQVLDIKGVQFDLLIPTAESRLESDYYETDQ